MELEYPYYTVGALIIGLIVLVLIGCLVGNEGDRRIGMIITAVVVAIAGFFGIRDNIIDVRLGERRAAETKKALEAKSTDDAKTLKATEQQVRDQLAENERYATALKEAVASTFALTAGSCDAVCQESVRRVVINLPASFSPEAVPCEKPEELKAALYPLLRDGKIRAGTSPAMNAVINCVARAQSEATQQAPR